MKTLRSILCLRLCTSKVILLALILASQCGRGLSQGYLGITRQNCMNGVVSQVIEEYNSNNMEGSSHYLGDKQDFDVWSEGPSSGISRERAFARNVEILLIA